jgi:hypothetical protein
MLREPSKPMNIAPLKVIKQGKKCLVTIANINPFTQRDAWLFTYILLCGHWRSKSDLLQNFGNNFLACLKFHGLAVPQIDDPYLPVATYLRHMLSDQQYQADIIRRDAEICFKQKIPLDIIQIILDDIPDDDDLISGRKRAFLNDFIEFQVISSMANTPVDQDANIDIRK